jgi:DNA-binding NtrC family response regulator
MNSISSIYRSILIVDDEEIILFGLKEILSDQGYNPITYSSADEALAALSTLPPLLCAVIDVELGEMTGFDFYYKLRKSHPKLLTIFISGYINEKNPILEKDRNTTFLAKPFRVDDLLQLIKTHGKMTHV